SVTTTKHAHLILSSDDLTKPGQTTPTLITASGSPTPWNPPAINGLSSTALQKITILAFVIKSSSEADLTTCPISLTASILIPLLVEPTFTEAHTRFVSAKA